MRSEGTCPHTRVSRRITPRVYLPGRSEHVHELVHGVVGLVPRPGICGQLATRDGSIYRVVAFPPPLPDLRQRQQFDRPLRTRRPAPFTGSRFSAILVPHLRGTRIIAIRCLHEGKGTRMANENPELRTGHGDRSLGEGPLIGLPVLLRVPGGPAPGRSPEPHPEREREVKHPMRMRITLDMEGPQESLDELLDDAGPPDAHQARARLETWVRNQVVISLVHSGIRGWHIARSGHEVGYLGLEATR